MKAHFNSFQLTILSIHLILVLNSNFLLQTNTKFNFPNIKVAKKVLHRRSLTETTNFCESRDIVPIANLIKQAYSNEMTDMEFTGEEEDISQNSSAQDANGEEASLSTPVYLVKPVVSIQKESTEDGSDYLSYRITVDTDSLDEAIKNDIGIRLVLYITDKYRSKLNHDLRWTNEVYNVDAWVEDTGTPDGLRITESDCGAGLNDGSSNPIYKPCHFNIMIVEDCPTQNNNGIVFHDSELQLNLTFDLDETKDLVHFLDNTNHENKIVSSTIEECHDVDNVSENLSKCFEVTLFSLEIEGPPVAVNDNQDLSAGRSNFDIFEMIRFPVKFNTPDNVTSDTFILYDFTLASFKWKYAYVDNQGNEGEEVYEIEVNTDTPSNQFGVEIDIASKTVLVYAELYLNQDVATDIYSTLESTKTIDSTSHSLVIKADFSLESSPKDNGRDLQEKQPPRSSNEFDFTSVPVLKLKREKALETIGNYLATNLTTAKSSTSKEPEAGLSVGEEAKKEDSHLGLILGASIGGGVFLALVALIIVILVRRRKKAGNNEQPHNEVNQDNKSEKSRQAESEANLKPENSEMKV